MHELKITPQGRLSLWENPERGTSERISSELIQAYQTGAISGILRSVGPDLDVHLPTTFEFAKSIGRLYLTHLCRSAGEEFPELYPADFEIEQTILSAPPMQGLEYLTPELVVGWWREIDASIREKVAAHPEGTRGYLKDLNPRWSLVGRVTLHLAENKRDPEYPFAFLATFANGLNAQGKVRHEPLGRALQQYAGKKNREAMLSLLLPISKAAESSALIKKLVDSEEIFHSQAWTAQEAYEFLRSIPEFESSGLIVRVPDWWNARKPNRPRVSVRVDSPNSASVGLDSMLRFSADVSLDGETLDQEEIQSLLESSGGLIPLKGRWVEVDPEKLGEALRHWKKIEKENLKGGISFFEGMRLLSGFNIERENDAKETQIREWTGLSAGEGLNAILRSLRSPETVSEPIPPGLKADLRPYQRTGFAWLRFVTRLGLGACLADDMGLGKTLQVIAMLLDLKREEKTEPSLLVVPASLIGNWKAELSRFAPSLRYAIAHSSEVTSQKAEIGPKDADGSDLIITTYGMLVRTDWLRQRHWRMAILDEAQAIKNSGTKQTRSVKELNASARIAMTGTPVENRLSDLWSLFDFLNPGLLGTSKQFSSFVKRLQQDDKPSFEPLRNLVRPYILRRLKTDKKVIADLPEKTEMTAYCGLSKHQAALYLKAVEELSEALNSTDGIQRRGIVLAQLMRLKQICNHPAQYAGSNDYIPERSGKFQRLAEIVREIDERQEKVLVFTQFREITDPLAEFLTGLFGRPGLILHGGTSVTKRREFVEQFQREEGLPFFILSLKAGGTGLNLTAASHVIHFDRWWNPATENQATDRAFRIGQKKNVLVHKFVCRGTVEERIDEMINRKRQVAEDAIGGDASGETLLTEMDDATLLKFVKLDLNHSTDA